MGAESNSGAADATATVTRPSAEVAARLSPFRTAFHGQISPLLNISASIIQGSAVGPVSYVVNAGDLIPLTPGNRFCKYADDTCLVIPASNIDSRTEDWTVSALGLVLAT